jgi:hypothetical protein
VLSAIWSELYPEKAAISFAQWIVFGVPLALTFLFVLWAFFSAICCRPQHLAVIKAHINPDMVSHLDPLLAPS